MHFSPWYRLYERILAVYQANLDKPGFTPLRRLIENTIRLACLGLMRWQGMHFPQRAIGDWWWTWRWRFEALLGWDEYTSQVWCRAWLQPGMTVLDVGGYIGTYSRLFSRKAGQKGHVLVFEAHPENFAVLQHNLPANRFPNVEVFNLAISDQNGILPLYGSPGSSNHSLSAGFTEAVETIQVQSVRLDTFLQERGILAVDFIKMDVEGSELRALTGLADTIARSPRLGMLVEYNPRALRCGGEPPQALITALQGLDLDVQVILPDGSLAPVPDGSDEAVVNLLCRKTPAAQRITTLGKR
jgi:FkbM family methyltransferase